MAALVTINWIRNYGCIDNLVIQNVESWNNHKSGDVTSTYAKTITSPDQHQCSTHTCTTMGRTEVVGPSTTA
jgi:hypothetical protein